MIPGVSDRAQCSAPLPPSPLWVVETTKTWTGWPAACRPLAAIPSWRRRCAGRQRHCLPGGEREGGAARRLVGFLAGVRRTSIEAGRYKAGWRWTRLSTAGGRGWRQRRRLGRRSRGRGTSSGVAGDGDGRGLDDRAADAPPLRFRGGSLLPPLVDTRRRRWLDGAWGLRSRRIGVN